MGHDSFRSNLLYFIIIPIVVGLGLGTVIYHLIPKKFRNRITLTEMMMVTLANACVLALLLVSVWNHDWIGITTAIFFASLAGYGDFLVNRDVRGHRSLAEYMRKSIWKLTFRSYWAFLLYGSPLLVILLFIIFPLFFSTTAVVIVNLVLTAFSLCLPVLINFIEKNSDRICGPRWKTTKIFSLYLQALWFDSLHHVDIDTYQIFHWWRIRNTIQRGDPITLHVEIDPTLAKNISYIIAVQYGKRTLGYLSRENTKELLPFLRMLKINTLEGKITFYRKRVFKRPDVQVEFRLPIPYSEERREIPSTPYLDEEGWIRFKLSPEPKSPRFNYRAQLFEGLPIYLSREVIYPSNQEAKFLTEGFYIYAKNNRPITGRLSAKDERYINEHLADISGFERIEGKVSSKQPGENGDYSIEIAIQLPEKGTINSTEKSEISDKKSKTDPRKTLRLRFFIGYARAILRPGTLLIFWILCFFTGSSYFTSSELYWLAWRYSSRSSSS